MSDYKVPVIQVGTGNQTKVISPVLLTGIGPAGTPVAVKADALGKLIVSGITGGGGGTTAATYAGSLTTPVFTDNGNGTGSIAALSANLFDNANGTGIAEPYSLTGVTLSFVDGAEEYIVADYNAGTPIIRKETVKANINHMSVVLLLTVWRQGTVLHSRDEDAYGVALPNKINSSIIHTTPYRISTDGGMILAETSTPTPRTVTVTPSTVYAGIVAQPVLAFDSSVDLLTLATVTNGTWTYTNQTVYDNDRYNPLTGPVPMNSNRYSNRYFYRSIGDAKQMFYVMGSDQYTSIALAQNESVPSIPALLRDHCILIGRITIQHAASSGVIQSALTTVFNNGGIINHNDTANLQGGSSGEYYHLSASQYNSFCPIGLAAGLAIALG